jgi:thiol-disulfide isomerase/thioredoxin
MSERTRSTFDRRKMLAALFSLGATPWAYAANEQRVTWTDITLIDGSVVRADELRAQPVVVEIWATWCPYCKKQNPSVQKLHETTAGKGLKVLTFAIDDDVELIRAYQRRYKYTFAVARSTPQIERMFAWGRGVPELYVVDTSGRIVVREDDEMFPEDVAALARFATGA